MENKIGFKGDYRFLNTEDFAKLCKTLACVGDVNMIKYGSHIYIKFDGDLSDLGNQIGLNVGHYIGDKLGYEKDDFIHGFNHGVSIIDGSHE